MEVVPDVSLLTKYLNIPHSRLCYTASFNNLLVQPQDLVDKLSDKFPQSLAAVSVF